jgi:hypothetical protein
MMTSRRVLVSTLLVLAACGESAVNEPTWIDDIRPIMAANCVTCHARPATGGAPPFFRLDKYGDTALPDGTTIILGAAAMADRIAERGGVSGSMPPDYPRPAWQRDTMVNWGAMPALGERAGNLPPAIELRSALPATAQDPFAIEYELTDPDRDLADGSLLARPSAGNDVLISAELRSGRGVVTIDLSTLDAGSYALVAALTDDLVEVEVELGSLSVP